jgi:transposase-like protein
MVRSLTPAKLAAWQKRLAQYKLSGLTVSTYCRRENLSPSQFYYWLRRVQKQTPVTPSPENSTDIELNRATCQSMVEVSLGSGAQ